MDYPLVTASINLDAIRYNISSLKQMTRPDCDFMAVVKADGYGHGAVKVAQTALDSGADWLGVARIEEAVELRSSGIDSPMLVFGYIHPDLTAMISDLNLTCTVWEPDMAETLSQAAMKKGVRIKAHLKVDTGMGRIGMPVEHEKQILNNIKKICTLPGLDLCGIYTHFASADMDDPAYTESQIATFKQLLTDLKSMGMEFACCHASNSAGIIKFPQAHFEMVRAGIAIYGCYPSNRKETSSVVLRPAMTLKSVVTSVKAVPKDFCVSYGMTHKTPKPTRLASVPIGYADGFSRGFSSNGFMLVKGQKAPIIGRVCMDQTMIDVGDISGVSPGDEVVILGSQNGAEQTAEELSGQINTINYEIVSAITARVKKIYSDSDSGSASGSG